MHCLFHNHLKLYEGKNVTASCEDNISGLTGMFQKVYTTQLPNFLFDTECRYTLLDT